MRLCGACHTKNPERVLSGSPSTVRSKRVTALTTGWLVGSQTATSSAKAALVRNRKTIAVLISERLQLSQEDHPNSTPPSLTRYPFSHSRSSLALEKLPRVARVPLSLLRQGSSGWLPGATSIH